MVTVSWGGTIKLKGSHVKPTSLIWYFFSDSLFSFFLNISAFLKRGGIYFDVLAIEFLLVFACAE